MYLFKLPDVFVEDEKRVVWGCPPRWSYGEWDNWSEVIIGVNYQDSGTSLPWTWESSWWVCCTSRWGQWDKWKYEYEYKDKYKYNDQYKYSIKKGQARGRNISEKVCGWVWEWKRWFRHRLHMSQCQMSILGRYTYLVCRVDFLKYFTGNLYLHKKACFAIMKFPVPRLW